MKKLRWAALLLCAALVLGLAGCIGNLYENVCTIDGTEISAGLYQYAQYSAHNEARNLREDTDKEVWEQQIEGKGAEDWVRARAEVLLRRYVAVQRLARTHNVTTSAEGQQGIEQMMSYWSSLEEDYLRMGITQPTMFRFMNNDDLRRQLMQKVYAEGGELYVPDAELKQMYAQENARLSFLTVPLTDVDDKDMTDAVLPKIDAVLAALRGGKTMAEMAGGADFVSLYKLLKRDYDAAAASGGVQTSYLEYEQDDNTLYTEDFLREVREAKVGDFGYYITQDGKRLLLYEIIPTFASDAEFADMRSNIITDLMADEYEQWLADLYNTYPVDWAFGARWFYGPKSATF